MRAVSHRQQAGLAIGFAVQDSLSNIFGGISLLLDKAVKVGDFVQLDSGESGEVIDVGLRSTKVKNWDNEVMIIPNGSLANSKFVNWKLPDLRARVVVPFGVEYGSDVKKVKKVVMDVIKKHKVILKDPEPAVRFLEMGDSSLKFSAFVWVDNISDKYGTKMILVEEIYDALNKNKIGIPFPTRTIYMKKAK